MSITITVLFVAAYFGITAFLCRGVKLNTKNLCICAAAVALTLVLEAIQIPLPTGATLPCASMVPLMLTALICDYRMAFIGGWICGVLAMLLVPGWQPVHWAQIFVEHSVCFSCLGYAGIFGNDKRYKILTGMLLASAIKFFGHLLSGVIFFSQNAWDGFGAWGYSFGYNLSTVLPLCILSGIIILALPIKSLQKAFGGTAE